MSDYKRGKIRVQVWAQHWQDVAERASANTTIEAKMVEYGTNIRKAFHMPSAPNILIMTPGIRLTHREIMELPVSQREKLIVWHFGDDEERKKEFGVIRREPAKIRALYEKLGRYHRGSSKQPWAKHNLR